MTNESRRGFVVATYNIHGCVGRDRRQDMERTAEVLRSIGFDVMGLQEVDSRGNGGSGSHQLSFLAGRTSSRGIPGPTILSAEGDYGNALLTRELVVDVARHDLSLPGREPRGALDVLLQVADRRARFVVTHLGLGPAERRFQVDALLDILEGEQETPTFLLGDFNEWFPWARSRRRLRRIFGTIPMPPTFPAGSPIFALDHVYARPRSAMRRLETVDDPLTRVASDHLPVRAIVDLDIP